MKLTVSQLRKIIKEEVQNTLVESTRGKWRKYALCELLADRTGHQVFDIKDLKKLGYSMRDADDGINFALAIGYPEPSGVIREKDLEGFPFSSIEEVISEMMAAGGKEYERNFEF